MCQDIKASRCYEADIRVMCRTQCDELMDQTDPGMYLIMTISLEEW